MYLYAPGRWDDGRKTLYADGTWELRADWIFICCFAAFSASALAAHGLLRWVARPMHFACPACGKDVPSDVPWVCGFCDAENRKRSFLRSCGACGRAPLAYECHHCGASFFPDRARSRDDRHRAYRIPVRAPGETLEQARARFAHERELHRQEMERIRGTIELHGMRQELERATGAPKPKPDPYKEAIDGILGGVTARVEADRRLRSFEREQRKAIEADAELSDDEKRDAAEELREAVAEARDSTYRLK